MYLRRIDSVWVYWTWMLGSQNGGGLKTEKTLGTRLQSLRKHRLKGSPEIHLFLVNYPLITCRALNTSESNQNRRKIAKTGYQRMPQRTCSKTSQISMLISATQRYPVDKQGIELTCITKLVLESLRKDVFKTKTVTGTRMQILMGYFYLI